MSNMNKWVLVVVAAIIVVAGVVVFARPHKQAAAPTGTSSNTTSQTKTFDPKNPGFVLGTVVTASASEIDFKVGATTDKAEITASTKLVKQIRDPKTKLISVADATIADFKAGQTVVVYFSTPAQNNVYQADKIQIISQ